MEELLRPAPEESAHIADLLAGIDGLLAQRAVPRLVAADGTAIEIPPSIFGALRTAVEAMSRGQAITLVPGGRALTTQQAADLLMVSRPHVVKLLDQGEIAHHRVGRNRRVRIEDVLDYRDRRRVARHEGLTELTRSAQAMGGYD